MPEMGSRKGRRTGRPAATHLRVIGRDAKEGCDLVRSQAVAHETQMGTLSNTHEPILPRQHDACRQTVRSKKSTCHWTRSGTALERYLQMAARQWHMAIRDFEMEQHEYRPGLRLRSLTFVNDDEIELMFEGIDTADRSWRVRRRRVETSAGAEIEMVNFEDDFNRLYRGIPLVSCGFSLNPLVNQAWVARGDQLPIGESWDRVFEEGKAELARRWAATHPEPD